MWAWQCQRLDAAFTVTRGAGVHAGLVKYQHNVERLGGQPEEAGPRDTIGGWSVG